MVSWGSRIVEDYYCLSNVSSRFGSTILHYLIVEECDDGSVGTAFQQVWHVVDNGVHKNWSQEYFKNALFWKPENVFVEEVLYQQDAHPGNVIY